MAITAVDYFIISKLKEQALIPTRPSVLELGEANWYGDVPLDQLASDIRAHVKDSGAQQAMLEKLAFLQKERPTKWLFHIAKLFHQVFFDYRLLDAIDLSGTDHAMRYDLNEPVHLEKTYDVVMNLGTAEHVFNVYQFFKTVHDLTAPGGLMIHVMPFNGWVDHGFYNFQPTFHCDLAAANQYHMHMLAYTELNPPKIHFCKERIDIANLAKEGKLGANALIYSVLSKPKTPMPFKAPMQGFYAGALSAEGIDAWKKLR